MQGEWNNEFGKGIRWMKSPDKNKPGAVSFWWTNPEKAEEYSQYLITPIFAYPSKDD